MDDGYLIFNYHVVKDAVKVRLLTGTGLLDASVVKVDAANDLALLKAVGAFKPLPVAASRTVKLGGTVAMVGFPDLGWQGFLTAKNANYTKNKRTDSFCVRFPMLGVFRG
jgi:S1-C subfamily serine protease